MTEDEVKLLPCAWRWRYVYPDRVGHWTLRQTEVYPMSPVDGFAGIEVEPLYTRAIEATRPPIGTDEVVERVARARQLARDNPSLKGWRVSDSHFFPWLSEHMGPENIEYLRLIVRNADTIARTLAAMKDAASD